MTKNVKAELVFRVSDTQELVLSNVPTTEDALGAVQLLAGTDFKLISAKVEDPPEVEPTDESTLQQQVVDLATALAALHAKASRITFEGAVEMPKVVDVYGEVHSLEGHGNIDFKATPTYAIQQVNLSVEEC